ncbi:tail fiber domain-containing protein [Thiothrix nivea]|uniref:Peptidase S74 domain-containing protein n=1 Tax=Thiothrix nivea (strain ATCC 35100 / DSM 5205 / JP2) TaxID=870187 RepID=A0A656HGI1_THINJ|nr:tail fiber domain-containing protein [Thiothrix nivea]EIJ34135.1 hypothetical protein Thini_1533 [Thiothrix nivea DSM 5205]
MKINKFLLFMAVQAILASTSAMAGDVEITLPAATDAFTVDQPAGTELMRINGNGNVGIGTATPSDGTANGGQALKLDVEGAVGAKHYCDENGENCTTSASLAAGNAGTAMAFKITTDDTTTTQTHNDWWKMDTEWSASPEINSFANSTFTNGTFTVGAGEAGLYEIFAKTNIFQDEGSDYTAIYINGIKTSTSAFVDVANVVTSSAYTLANLNEGDTVEVYGYYNHSTTDQNLSCSVGRCYLTLQKIGAAAGGGGSADNLGDHTATKNIDLAANKLVGNGGTEGIIINATGNVGIGNAAPSGKLDVKDANGGLGLFGGATFAVRDSGNVLVTRNTSTNTSNLGQIIMERGNGSGDDMALTTEYDGSNGVQSLGVASGNNMLMSIFKGGKVGIGTTNPASKLEVEGGGIRTNYNASYDVWIQGGPTTAGGDSRNLALVGAIATGNDRLVLNWNGEYKDGTQVQSNLAVAGTVTQSSDERLKTDIQPVTEALAKVKQLQGVTFKWKDPTGKDADTQLGLIAQQVEKVVPEVVETANDEDKTKSVSYANLVALLIEGMKEQQAQIEAQQQRIDALEAKLK